MQIIVLFIHSSTAARSMRDENEKSLKLIIIIISYCMWLDDGLYNQIHFDSQLIIGWNVRTYLSTVPTTASQQQYIQSKANEMFTAF